VVREWTAVTVLKESNPGGFIGRISSVIPRRHGDVFAIGHQSNGGLVVVRLARTPQASQDAGAPGAILIRSDLDQQNEIRNARGARRWAGGSCNNIFVPFPIPRDAVEDAGIVPAAYAFFTARKAAIVAAIAKMTKDKTKGRAEVEIVKGTLDGRTVAGALFLRTFPEASQELMEAAVSRVAEIVTTNPATPPEVMCAAPTIDNILHTVKAAPSYGDDWQ
jgi:hypothetical protein